MMHKTLYLKKIATYLSIFLLPLLISSCSAFSGGSSSNDPAVIAQRQQVEILESEVRAQKQRRDEAEGLYKREDNLLDAKQSELKAAKQLLKVYKNQSNQ